MTEIDVFLSHNSTDKPAVRDLKRRLVEAGLKVWYDEDELRPGIPFQKLLEAGIKNSASIAVLVGQDGLGPWEDEEMQAALVLGVKENRPVIPVLLPSNQTEPPEIPLFLGTRRWVDLRSGFTKEGLDLLIWGATGRRPGGPEPPFNFVLQIGERQGDVYPVLILESPAGLGEHVMKLPFEDLERKLILKTLEVARLRSSGNTRLTPAGSGVSPDIQDFGRRLFESLLEGDVYRSYDDARRAASKCNTELRLQLSIQAPDLATLPWEYLYDSNRREYLALSRGTPLVRYFRPMDPKAPSIPPCAAERIRILGMLSSPLGMPPLDLAKERERIEKSLTKLIERGAVELVWVKGNTIEELNNSINNYGPWHVFHFVGHGRFDAMRGEGCIVTQDERGAARDFLASKLGTMLHDHRSLQLVVLNACETGTGNNSDVFSSTAASLVQRGIPAVLAMQYPISDGAASIFAAWFYESLAKGSPVDIADRTGHL